MPKSREYNQLKEKYQRFTWSQPVGYSFEDVEEALEGYDKTILEAKSVIEQKDEELAEKNEEIIRLQQELTQCQQMLAEIQIPVDEGSGKSATDVLNEFAGETAFTEADLQETGQFPKVGDLEDKSQDKHAMPPILS